MTLLPPQLSALAVLSLIMPEFVDTVLLRIYSNRVLRLKLIVRHACLNPPVLGIVNK